MATRDIRLWPDAVLTQDCAVVDLADRELPALIADLFETMYSANGRGLAAPQIGVLQRVFVVDVTWKEGAHDPRIFINPNVVSVSEDSVLMDEQCLSIPDFPMPVYRPEEIVLSWTDAHGEAKTSKFDGILARCIQHELDHLNGKVIFDHQTASARAELEAAYVA
ncbi:MAG: peptide deformylase [Octadecabacter sp.]